MTWGKQTSDRVEINIALDALRKAAPPPPEATIYEYMRKLHRLRRKYDSSSLRTALRGNNPGKTSKRKRSVTRLIVDATMGSHVSGKRRWKYEQVEEFARSQKVTPKAMEEFIRKNGGINGCATKYRECCRLQKNTNVSPKGVKSARSQKNSDWDI